MDALSDILQFVRLKSSVYFQSAFPKGWGMNITRGPYAQFHIIVDGHCYIMHESLKEPRVLYPGDMVMFPHGDQHWLSHSPDSRRDSGIEVVQKITEGKAPFEGDKPGTTIICGHFELDRDLVHPAINELPEMIYVADHIRRKNSWLESIANIIIQESGSTAPGASVLSSRLADALFIQMVRIFMEESKALGYCSALKDRVIKMALDLIHNCPGQDWSVGLLARQVGVSRTSFANRFRQLVGTTPMNYLTDWRMLKAREMLKEGNFPLVQIAENVGYHSETSFIRVFRKKFNQTPARFRRSLIEKAV